MNKLKGCPFCGWPAVLSTEIPKYYGRQAAFVKCTNNKCRAEGPMCNIHEVIFTEGGVSTPVTVESLQRGIDEAVEKWNKRTA